MDKLVFTVEKDDAKKYFKDILHIKEFQITFTIVFVIFGLQVLPSLFNLISALYSLIPEFGFYILILPPVLVLHVFLLLLVFVIWNFYNIQFYVLWKTPEQIVMINSEGIIRNSKIQKWQKVRAIYNTKSHIIILPKLWGRATVIPKRIFKTEDDLNQFLSLVQKNYDKIINI